MVTSEKARKIIRIWTKRKWKCSLFSLTSTPHTNYAHPRGFLTCQKGIERFLEKRGSRNFFGPISKSRRSRFWWVSKSLFWGWFLRLSLEFYFIIIIFFFAYGSRTLGFVIFPFMGTAYRKGLVDLDIKNKTKQHIGGPALASNFDFGNFISFYLYHLLEIFGA